MAVVVNCMLLAGTAKPYGAEQSPEEAAFVTESGVEEEEEATARSCCVLTVRAGPLALPLGAPQPLPVISLYLRV